MAESVYRVRMTGDGRNLRAEADLSARNLKSMGDAGKKSNRELSTSAKVTERSYTMVASAIGLVTSALAGYSISRTVQETVALTRETNAWAQAVGLTASELQAYNYVGEQVGFSQRQLGDIFKDTAEKIADAYTSGGGEAADALEKIGLQAKDLVALKPNEQLLKIASALDSVQTQGEKVFVLESLANDATLLEPLLRNDAKLMRELVKEAQTTGAAISDIDNAKLVALGSEFSRLGAHSKGFSNQLTVALAPAVFGITQELDQAVARWGGMGNVAQKAVDVAVTGLGFVLDITAELNTYIKAGQVGWLALGKYGVDALVNTGEAGVELVNKALKPIHKTLGLVVEGYAKLLGLAAEALEIDVWREAAAGALAYSRNIKDTTYSLGDFKALQEEISEALSVARAELAALSAAEVPSEALQNWFSKHASSLDDIAKKSQPASQGIASIGGAAEVASSGVSKLDKLLARLYPNESAAKKYIEDFRELSAELDGAALENAIKQLNEEFAGAESKAKDSANGIAQIYKDTATSIHGSFRGAFRDVLDGQNSFADRLKATFKDMLADMATLAIARPIIVPLTTGLGGLMGVPSSAQANVAMQLGGFGGGHFGSGMMAGITGGFGSATALNGMGATTMGAYLGAAMPYIAGAFALDSLTGGGLFGGKWKTRSSGFELAYDGGDVSGQKFIKQKKKKSLFRGTKSRTKYSNLDGDTLDALNATFDDIESAIIGGAHGLGITTAEEFLAGFSSGTQRIKLKGKNDEQRQAAIQKWIDGITAEMYQGLLQGTGFGGLLRQFDSIEYAKGWKGRYRIDMPKIVTDFESMKQMGDAIFSLGAYFDSSSLADFDEISRLSGLSLREQLQEQFSSTRHLSDTYDGGLEATRELAEATRERYQLELQYLAEIANVSKSITQTLGDSVETIFRSTLSTGQLYEHLTGQAETFALELQTALDPTRINYLVGEIDSLTMEAYRLLGNGGAPYAQDYMQFLKDVEQTAQTQLSKAQEEMVSSQQRFTDVLQGAMERVSARIEESANAQVVAAQGLKAAAEAQLEAAIAMQRRLREDW